MPIPLEPRYYPTDFQVTTVTLVAPTLQQYPVFLADRDCVIDSVTVYVEDNLTTARDMKVKEMVSTDGNPVNTLPTYATTSQDLNTAASTKTFSTTAGDYPQTHTFVMNSDRNFIPKGSRLWIQASGALAGIAGTVSVQVRWRSHL